LFIIIVREVQVKTTKKPGMPTILPRGRLRRGGGREEGERETGREEREEEGRKGGREGERDRGNNKC
jgi:hypothetical protein